MWTSWGSGTEPPRFRYGLYGTIAIPVAAGDRYAILKREQQRRGLPLDENDLWIAATALALGTTLVSYDSDFQPVETLVVIRPGSAGSADVFLRNCPEFCTPPLGSLWSHRAWHERHSHRTIRGIE